MALSEVTTATIIALTVLLIVTTVGYYTILAGAAAASHATASRAAASKFTPTCTVGLTGGSMPIIDPAPYPAGCAGCSRRAGATMNCCSASEVPPAVE